MPFAIRHMMYYCPVMPVCFTSHQIIHMRLLGLLYALILYTSAAGQQADSLRSLLQKAAADTMRVRLLTDISLAEWQAGSDSLGVVYANQALMLAKKAAYPLGEANARLLLARIEADRLTDLKPAYAHMDTALRIAKKIKDKQLEGRVYIRQAQFYREFFEKQDQVMPLLDKALQLFIEVGDKGWQGTVYNEKGQRLSNEGKYAEAIDLLLKARKLQEETGDLAALRSTLPNLGVMYAAIKFYPQALEIFDAAEQIANKRNDNILKAFIYNQRGDILEKQQNYPAALEQFQKAAAIHAASGAVYWLPRTYGRIGAAYIALKQYDKALYYTALADSMYKSQVDANESLDHYCQINFGKIYLEKKQYDKVVHFAKEGLLWAEEADPKLLREAAEYHRQLAEAYDKLGKPALALQHFRMFKSEADSLLNSESKEQAMASTMNYEFDKKQQAQLIQIQTLRNEKLTQTRNYLLALLAAGLLLSAFIIWYNYRLRKKNQELVRKNREIEEALFKGQKIERKRVASELHDNLNTKLAALRWRLEAMDTSQYGEPNQKIHDSSLQMLEDIYADVRLISHSMIPQELETHGLSAALQKLVDKLNINSRTEFHLVEHGFTTRPPASVEHQLYNISLELVNNVLKHAQATHVWISLSNEAGLLRLTVSDNGVGMPENLQHEGMGMDNLKSRVEALSGHMQVHSGLDAGTKVEVEVKLL